MDTGAVENDVIWWKQSCSSVLQAARMDRRKDEANTPQELLSCISNYSQKKLQEATSKRPHHLLLLNHLYNPIPFLTSALRKTRKQVLQMKPLTKAFRKSETLELPTSPRTSKNISTTVGKKSLCTKKTGKSAKGLGARRLATKSNESLYDQKPEETLVQVSSTNISNSSTPLAAGSLSISRFEYADNAQPTDVNSGVAYAISHVSPPKTSNFFVDYGMDSGFPKKNSSSLSKVQEVETNEARKKFCNAKSISSAQFFGGGENNNANDLEASVSCKSSHAELFGHDSSSSDLTASDIINRLSFQAQQDISSLKNIAGETGKKIGSLASTILTDLQDRIL
ncbi:UNVERIFIED_CONTAM: putative ADP-ribosylation factor GTPase-activating protein AGD8 [Sesamum calycinum]|uniref:ADP-ribosylation factor GTPase-activating protein AGD8 n=1 Tax=Sesamum calycinum TaxID=2727403 RepID=A0AAW2IY03_9LAMI